MAPLAPRSWAEICELVAAWGMAVACCAAPRGAVPDVRACLSRKQRSGCIVGVID